MTAEEVKKIAVKHARTFYIPDSQKYNAYIAGFLLGHFMGSLQEHRPECSSKMAKPCDCTGEE